MTVLTPQATRRSRRFAEQRWVLDAVVRTVGLDWDQGRTGYAMSPCGLVAAPDFAHVARNVHAFDDISRKFATAGARRLARARTAIAEAHPVAARAHYFVASVLFGQAQWPLFENSDDNDRSSDARRAVGPRGGRQLDGTSSRDREGRPIGRSPVLIR